MLRRATALKRICDRQRVQNAVITDMNIEDAKAHILCIQMVFIRLQLIKI